MPRIIDLVVIGTSAGGVEALCTVVKSLPDDFKAAVLIVMHVGKASVLPAVLNHCGTLSCTFVRGRTAIKRGRVYIAPPNYHMRVSDGKMALSQGPKENYVRPSIDPLFRSAARTYGKRVIGIILTGALHDGSAGLFAIKNYGGVAIVQDPAEAFQPSMPTHAMRQTKVDYCVPLEKIGSLLVRLVGRNSQRKHRVQPT